jgi:hypothetical protein
MKIAVFLLVVAVVAAGAGMRLRSRSSRERALASLCRTAGVAFAALDPFPDVMLLPFRLFGRGDLHWVENVLWEPADGDGARVFDYRYVEREDRGASVSRSVTCALVPLPFGVPALAIVPRGAADVSREPTATRRVDLELEAFNRRFDVFAEDPRAAVAFLDQRMMDAIMQVPLRVAIHVHEDRMLLVGPLLDPGAMLLLLEVARTLATRVPPVVASLYPPRPMEGPFEDRWMQGSWSPDPISADDPNRADLGG